MQTQTIRDRFLTVGQFADDSGFPKPTVYKLVRTGQLKTCRVGARILIPTAEYDRFVKDLLAQLGDPS